MFRASHFLLLLAFLLPASLIAKPSPKPSVSHRHPCLEAARLDFGSGQVGVRRDSISCNC